MLRPHLHRALLLWLLVGVASPALAEAALDLVTDAASHSGSSCPDSDDDGHPCGPACPCACCPGHRIAPAIASAGTTGEAAAVARFQSVSLEAAHPEDVLRRIFHPPRA